MNLLPIALLDNVTATWLRVASMIPHQAIEEQTGCSMAIEK